MIHFNNGHGCPICGGSKRLNTKEYQNKVSKDIQVLGTYKNNYTKILHKHACGFEWLAQPRNILQGQNCPKCSKSGFKANNPAILYLIYFPALKLYKVGITNRSIKQRFKNEKYYYEIVFYRIFSKGLEARALETKWIKNLTPYMYNSEELHDGNTETFYYENTV